MKTEPQTGMDFERSELEPVKNKKSLYNIMDDYSVLMNSLEESEGLLTEEMESELAINEKELQKKSIGYLEVIKTKEAFNLLIDNEIKRLQGLKKTNNNVIDRLKGSLLNAVNFFGEFKVGTLTFGVRKSSSLIIENEDLIPNKYKTKTVTIKIDKNQIKKDLKNGTVDSAYIHENLNLSIK